MYADHRRTTAAPESCCDNTINLHQKKDLQGYNQVQSNKNSFDIDTTYIKVLMGIVYVFPYTCISSWAAGSKCL